MAIACRTRLCVYSPDDDDDVLGHSATPVHTATLTITWTEDGGDGHVKISSADPEAERILLDLLNGPKKRVNEGAAPA